MRCKLRLSFTCLRRGDVKKQTAWIQKKSSKSRLSIFVSLNSNSKNLIFLPNFNSDLLKSTELILELEEKLIEFAALVETKLFLVKFLLANFDNKSFRYWRTKLSEI